MCPRTLPRYRAAGGLGRGPGQRLGVAYVLDGGDVVYVPDGESAAAVERR